MPGSVDSWGLLALVLLVAGAAVRVAGAALARPYYRRINQNFDAWVAYPSDGPNDRTILDTIMMRATDIRLIVVLALAAPFLAVIGTVVGVAGYFYPPIFDRIERIIPPPSYPEDPRLAQIDEDSVPALLLSSPFLAAWSMVWLSVPAMLFARHFRLANLVNSVSTVENWFSRTVHAA